MTRTAVSLICPAEPVDALGAGVLGLGAVVVNEASLPVVVPPAFFAITLKWYVVEGDRAARAALTVFAVDPDPAEVNDVSCP